MLMKDLKTIEKKVLLTKKDRPESIIGYTTHFIENGIPSATEICVNLKEPGDYAILLRAKNLGCKVTYKVAGRKTIAEFTGEFKPELEQFCKVDHRTEMTLDKVKNWFAKNSFKFGDTARIIQTTLNLCKNTEDLEDTYRNLCVGLAYDWKPFRIKQTDIDDFNRQLSYVYDNKEERGYMGEDVRRMYNWKGEYEEHPLDTYAYTRKISSYNAQRRKSREIATELDICTVLAYAEFMDKLELPENVYVCECGAFVHYRTADVEWDTNRGTLKVYPDVDVYCPHCGALRLER